MFSFSWEGFSNKRQIYWKILVLLFKYYLSEGVKLVLQPIQVLGRRYHQQATEGLGLKGVPKKEHSSEFKHKFCRPPQTTHPPI